MGGFLLDTDILSYIMKKNPTVLENFNKQRQKTGSIFVSRISIVEIMGGLKARNAERQIKEFNDLIVNHKILDTTELSAESSSGIYAHLSKMGRHSGNYDILIAGIAISNNLKLVTNNEKDYENIDGLEIVNWTLISEDNET